MVRVWIAGDKLEIEQIWAIQKIQDSANLDNGEIKVPLKTFRILIKLLVYSFFNEEYYLRNNPDVREAFLNGDVESALHHFTVAGIFEGRLPCPIYIDEKNYLEKNPDVNDIVSRGTIQSAQAHFDIHGYKEGRAFRLRVLTQKERIETSPLHAVP